MPVFEIRDPESIKFRLKWTLTLGEWKQIREALGACALGDSPIPLKFITAIGSMVNQATGEFYPEPEEIKTRPPGPADPPQPEGDNPVA